MNFEIVDYKNHNVILLDQRKLPVEETYVTLSHVNDVAEAIRNMTVRGAPAIGVTAAMGLALAAYQSQAKSRVEFNSEILSVSDMLFATRPTAVNLVWALKKMLNLLETHSDTSVEQLKVLFENKAIAIKLQDIADNKAMGQHGQNLLKDGNCILTHCNAGALATAGFGTALGVVYAAVENGKRISVYADETRPVLQGARLTAWELQKNNIPVTVICDNMAASLMAKNKIDKVIVGADRIAANGDTANKIGTYAVAIMAHHHKIPFYVAAPLSTIDISTPNGKMIPIEERASLEVQQLGSTQLTPKDVSVYNPAFDVTPHELITAIITERGIIKPPFAAGLGKLFRD